MNAPNRRKIAYLLGIVALFSSLIVLSRYLDRTAEKHQLAQKSLGKVKPVSGVAQLVLLGFRGVAVTFLWNEAIELRKKERWFEIRPVLESITLLQPNFVEPWKHQAWNMAYNIAGEWESVPDKYYWIHQGIDFMKNANDVNREKCDLEWYTGWIYHNRFGVSDEHVFLREMFRDDPDTEFTVSKRLGIKDSFLCGYDWFAQASDTVLAGQSLPIPRRPKSMGVHPFMCYTAMSRTTYADFLGREGTFGEKSKNAWREAYNEWLAFGRLGKPERGSNVIFRLEYSPSEWSALTDEQRYWAQRYGDVVKYRYWKNRAKSEATDEMQLAREAFYQATQARQQGDYQRAISEFEKAFPVWRKVVEGDVNLRTDDMFIEDSQKYESQYLKLLTHLDLPAPKQRPFEGLFPALAPITRLPPAHRDLQRPAVPRPDSEPATKKAAVGP